VDAGHRAVDVADLYQVDPFTIRRWRRHRTSTGSCQARPRPGRRLRIGCADESGLAAQVRAQPDATLAEHCARWRTSHGVAVNVPTIARAPGRLNLTLKKRP
jgi:transposase